MRKALFWIGSLLCALGAALIVTSAVLNYMGFGTSYNLGDPAKFEFILVPVWQIGVVIELVGGACLIGWRWLKTNAR
jgi:hypothetical protein